MKVYCIQDIIKNGDVEWNVKSYFDKISLCDSGIVLLPEMWFCGFDYKNIQSHADASREIIDRLQKVAVDKLIISSMPERLNEKIYNSVYIISSEGVVDIYRKQFLFSPQKEDQYFEKHDNDVPVVKYKEINLSVATCYEIRFPEVFRIGAYKGADLFLIPAIWPVNKKEHWLTLLKSRAIENQAYVVGCSSSSVFNNGKELACGYSAAFDPWGEELFVLDEGVKTSFVNLDLEKLRLVRNAIPSLKDAKNCFNINKKTA
ncbi:MAG: hypothetical protein LDL13_05500 [Calditerrivibrio sp.]|nr:hypothetical protein [Calditerrivibrio sp.]